MKKYILELYRLRSVEKKFIQSELLAGALLASSFTILTIYLGVVKPEGLPSYLATIVLFYTFWAVVTARLARSSLRMEYKEFKKKMDQLRISHLLREKALENIQLSYEELSSGKIETKLNEAIASIATFIEASKGRLWVKGEDGLELRSTFGSQPPIQKIRPLSKTGISHSFKTGKIVLANHPDKDPRINKKLLAGYPIQNAIYVPLKNGKNVIGVLGLADKKGGFTQRDAKLLESISTSLATCLHNVDLATQLNKRFEEEEKFIVDLVHNLKTPLAAARGELEFLFNEKSTKEKFKETISFILSCIDRTSNTIKGALGVSLTPSKETKEPTDLSSIVQDITEMALVIAQSRGIQIKILGRKNLAIFCNREKVFQALSNVVDNALKFTPQGGLIEINLRKINNSAFVKIRDNGPGIPRRDLDKVFTRFWRGQGNGQLGSGLGLSITKSIVESQNGQIDLQSKVGQGTTVTIKLPIQPKS